MLRRLKIRVLLSTYAESELYDTLTRYRLLPSDAIIALTCRHYGISTI
jgi:predicted nucleic acid-binding protein